MKMEIMSDKMESEDSDEKYGKYDEYEVERWASTLEEAEEIKADAEKMKYVKMCMEEKAKNIGKAISSIADLKKARQKLPV